MKFPDTVTVIARDRDSGLPVEKVACVLTLFAARKNHYSVGPSVTNPRGEVVFTRDDCNFSIDRAQKMFVMDYSGDLESCLPMIELSLHPPERLATMERRYNETPEIWGSGFRDPKKLFSELQSVRNAEYEPASLRVTQDQLLSNPVIELRLERKRASESHA